MSTTEQVPAGEAEFVGDTAPDPRWVKAEALRRIQVYQRAGGIFKELWESTNDPSAGWRLAFCLRKMQRLNEAMTRIQGVVEAFPDHPQVVREHVWCLYEVHLRPATQQGSPQEITEAARALVAAGAEDVALRLAVFAAISAARSRGHWDDVSAWCELLDPETLNNQPRGQRGRTNESRRLSDRERWYYAKLKAGVQLGDFEVTRTLGVRCVREFPRNHDFQRWLAASDRGMDDTEEAVRRLIPLAAERAAPWYLLADLALYQLELGQLEAAWDTCRRACRIRGQVKSKVGLFETAARISLGLDAPKAARDHLGLCLTLRQQEEWKIRDNLLEFEEEVSEACGLDWEDPERRAVPEWLTRCQQHWSGPLHGDRSSASASANASQAAPQATQQATQHAPPRSTPQTARDTHRKGGRVTDYHHKRPFAFIEVANEKEHYRVKVSDLPKTCRHDGAEVEFSPRPSFDRKSNQPIQQASEVEPTKTD